MNKSSNKVDVKIHGKNYKIKALADSDYAKQVADYVNKKMSEVEKTLDKTQADTRIAVLAAMNITDELFRSKNKDDFDIKNIKDKSEDLIELIDQNINS